MKISFTLTKDDPAFVHFIKSFEFQVDRKATTQEIREFFGNYANCLINDLDFRDIDTAISEDFNCVRDYLDMDNEPDDE